MPGIKKGGMFILSSPSGAGKTTLVKKISRNRNYIVSVSHTTRPPRPSEKTARIIFLYQRIILKNLLKKRVLEHAKVFDNYYGSSKKIIIKKLMQGKNIIFDIDWQGTRQIRNKKLKFDLTTIFILPPSKNELLKRLIKREKQNMKTVKKRMKEFKKDLSKWKEYDHVVINDNLKTCYNEIIEVIKNKKKASFDNKFIHEHVKKLLN